MDNKKKITAIATSMVLASMPIVSPPPPTVMVVRPARVLMTRLGTPGIVSDHCLPLLPMPRYHAVSRYVNTGDN